MSFNLSKKEKRELERWARRAVHGLDQSAVMVGVLDDAPLGSGRIEFTLQLGHALLTGKPIVLTIPRGVQLPPKVAAIADRIVYYDPGHLESIQAGVTQALTELGINKQ